MTKLLIAFISILSVGRHFLCAAAGRLQSRPWHKNMRMTSGGWLHVVRFDLIISKRPIQFNVNSLTYVEKYVKRKQD